MEEHKRLFLEKAKEIGFSIVIKPKDWKKIDKPPYTGDPGLTVVIKPESEFYSEDNEAKVVEWLETEKGSSEAARYCLVCGHIPFTKENVALVVSKDTWYISGGRIPREMHKRFIDIAEESKDFWTLDDDLEEEHLELLEQTLDGVHIEAGRLKDVKVAQRRKVKVYQTYYTPTIDKKLFTA